MTAPSFYVPAVFPRTTSPLLHPTIRQSDRYPSAGCKSRVGLQKRYIFSIRQLAAVKNEAYSRAASHAEFPPTEPAGRIQWIFSECALSI